MDKKIRWGVIGAGGIADRRTIPGMMLCDNAELVAVMEINEELAENCRAKWGCPKAYTNEADLLADPDIDAVYIATPVVFHAKQAMMAAENAKAMPIIAQTSSPLRLAHSPATISSAPMPKAVKNAVESTWLAFLSSFWPRSRAI